jgi:hypothetical protein
MPRRLLSLLIVLNAALALALASPPAHTQILPRGIFDCCKVDESLDLTAYCCRKCCWFTHDCEDDGDCREIEEE